LPACSMPLLILWGDADVIAYPTPEKRRSACQKAAPHAEVDIIPDAGHMAQWEQPDIFNERVLKFLQT
ncbi:MAG: alpha/beta hydrolase, partial [Nitrospinae bacterium]|nr:alpha/beta hydrolase [Nitrospinota bacterium]